MFFPCRCTSGVFQVMQSWNRQLHVKPVDNCIFHDLSQVFLSFPTQIFFYYLIIGLLVANHRQLASKLLYVAYKAKYHLLLSLTTEL